MQSLIEFRLTRKLAILFANVFQDVERAVQFSGHVTTQANMQKHANNSNRVKIKNVTPHVIPFAKEPLLPVERAPMYAKRA